MHLFIQIANILVNFSPFLLLGWAINYIRTITNPTTFHADSATSGIIPPKLEK